MLEVYRDILNTRTPRKSTANILTFKFASSNKDCFDNVLHSVTYVDLTNVE